MKYAENNILLYSVSIDLVCNVHVCMFAFGEQKPRKEMVGKVCVDYIDYRQQEKIGHGGFGNVYKLSTKLGDVAVKEEHKVCCMHTFDFCYHQQEYTDVNLLTCCCFT